MNLVEVGVNVAIALASGSVGGVLAAGPIARRSEKAKRRYEAELGLVTVLETYRDVLRHDHDRLYELNHYPEGYASLAGQEKLAEEVLQRLPNLPHRKRKAVRTMLQRLVGAITMRFAESRLRVPEEHRSLESEQNRLALAIGRMRQDSSYATEHGVLGQLLASQNQPPTHRQQYDEAIAILERMIILVKP